MKRQVVERLLTVAGLSLFLIVGLLLSLWATGLSSVWAQGEIGVELDFLPEAQEIPAGEVFTLTAQISGDDLVSVTNLYLQIIPPPGDDLILDSTSGSLTWSVSDDDFDGWETIDSLSRVVRFQSPEDTLGSFLFTATLEYTYTVEGGIRSATISNVSKVEVGAPVQPFTPTVTITPRPTFTPSPTSTPITSPLPTPTSTPTPTSIADTPSPTPTVTVVPSVTPIPTPSSPFAPIIGPLKDLVVEQPLMALAICLVPLIILLLVLVLTMLARRRRRAVPPTPGTSMPPSAPAPAGPYLEAVDTAGTTHRFPLTSELTIGRAPDNDLTITKNFSGWETVSHYHARLYNQGVFWIVEDLQSSNGVYVNGQRTGLNRLFDNYRLGIGGVDFVFHTGKEA